LRTTVESARSRLTYPTTTDGRTNPIVWTLGAEGDNRLHGFRGDTGELLITTPSAALTGLRHFQTPIATPNAFSSYAPGDGRLAQLSVGGKS
jgi:hypothetical protein